MYRTTVCIRETGNWRPLSRLSPRGLKEGAIEGQLGCRRGTRAMFTEEGLRRREENRMGLRREGAQCYGPMAEPWPSGCEVLGPILSAGKGESKKGLV